MGYELTRCSDVNGSWDLEWTALVYEMSDGGLGEGSGIVCLPFSASLLKDVRVMHGVYTDTDCVRVCCLVNSTMRVLV